MRKDAIISMTEPTQEEIAALAYRYWELEGRPQNRQVAHWLLAEAALAVECRRRADRARRAARARKARAGSRRVASGTSHRQRVLVEAGR